MSAPDGEKRAVAAGRRGDVQMKRRVFLDAQLALSAQRTYKQTVGRAGFEGQQVLVQEADKSSSGDDLGVRVVDGGAL